MVQLGIERLLEAERHHVAGRKAAVVTNYTMCDGQLAPVIDRLQNAFPAEIAALFGPEHGVRSEAREGESVESGTDEHSGLPVFSLYGEVRTPRPEMLAGLDVLIFDLQDIGSRYYTNLSTLAAVMGACEQAQVACLVLDRPNPISGRREGRLVQEGFTSFVGQLPVPARHGMTMGEMARWIRRTRLPGLDLSVVPLGGWEREMYLDETGLPFVPSSPNTTGVDMMTLYPGTCLAEGVNVSVGRGTAKPFELIGAPYIDGFALAQAFNRQDLEGIRARPVFFRPWRSEYAGKLCQGVQLHVTDRRRLSSWRAGITVLQAVHDLYPADFAFTAPEHGRPFFDLLAGSAELGRSILEGRGPGFCEGEAPDLEQFQQETAPDLLY